MSVPSSFLEMCLSYITLVRSYHSSYAAFIFTLAASSVFSFFAQCHSKKFEITHLFYVIIYDFSSYFLFATHHDLSFGCADFQTVLLHTSLSIQLIFVQFFSTFSNQHQVIFSLVIQVFLLFHTLFLNYFNYKDCICISSMLISSLNLCSRIHLTF